MHKCEFHANCMKLSFECSQAKHIQCLCIFQFSANDDVQLKIAPKDQKSRVTIWMRQCSCR